MTDEITRNVDKVFDGLEGIVEHGGHREVKEAAEALAAMDWFRNFGYGDVEFRFVELRERFEEELREEDLPDVWRE